MAIQLQVKTLTRSLRKPIRLGAELTKERRSTILRIENLDTSAVAYGEAATLPAFGTETSSEATKALTALAQKTFTSPDQLKEASTELTPTPCAQSAVQMALLWLENRPFPKDNIASAALAQSPHEAATLESPCIKIKVTNDDFDAVKTYLSTCTASKQIRLDFNGQLSFEQAQHWCVGLASYPNLEYIEQPLPDTPWNIEKMAKLQGVPIALDESVSTFSKLITLAQDWTGLMVIKPALFGDWFGFCQWRKSFEERLVYSSAFETAFGFESLLRLCSGAKRASGLGTNQYFLNDAYLLHSIHAPYQAGVITNKAFEQCWNQLP